MPPLSLLAVLVSALPPAPADDPPVDFDAQVRPIFREYCLSCHGPDKQKSGLRLDRKADALKGGDLGRSIFFNQPVLQVIFARAEPTTFLTLFSILIAVVIALPVGVLSAYWRGTWFDQGALSTAMLLASIPSFWLGLIFQQHLTGGGILPVSGFGDPGSGFLDQMRYLILPSLVLGLVNSALIIRFSRASMLDVLSDDYVRTARAKGMSEWRVVLRHAFKNALIPIITVVGLTFALLISGAVVTERVFNLPGVGSLVVGAVLRRDYPLIQGTLIVIAGLYILINFAIDMIYLLVDPRVRY